MLKYVCQIPSLVMVMVVVKVGGLVDRRGRRMEAAHVHSRGNVSGGAHEAARAARGGARGGRRRRKGTNQTGQVPGNATLKIINKRHD